MIKRTLLSVVIALLVFSVAVPAQEDDGFKQAYTKYRKDFQSAGIAEAKVELIKNFLLKYPLNDWLNAQMADSIVTLVLLKIGIVLVPLFPEAVKKLKSFM